MPDRSGCGRTTRDAALGLVRCSPTSSLQPGGRPSSGEPARLGWPAPSPRRGALPAICRAAQDTSVLPLPPHPRGPQPGGKLLSWSRAGTTPPPRRPGRRSSAVSLAAATAEAWLRGRGRPFRVRGAGRRPREDLGHGRKPGSRARRTRPVTVQETEPGWWLGPHLVDAPEHLPAEPMGLATHCRGRALGGGPWPPTRAGVSEALGVSVLGQREQSMQVGISPHCFS